MHHARVLSATIVLVAGLAAVCASLPRPRVVGATRVVGGHGNSGEPPVVQRCTLLHGGQSGESSSERTFAMLKPDVAADATTVEEIKELITSSGLTIEREQMCELTRGECEEFYAEHSERPFFGDLVEFMSSGPVLQFELSGPDAVKRWRELIGPTNSNNARDEAPSSIRARFGTDNQRNAAHGSDSTEAAERELRLCFKNSEA